MHAIWYFIKEAFRGFFEAKMMTFVSIVTIGISLFFLGLGVTVYLNLDKLIKDARSQAAVVVYVTDERAGDEAMVADLLGLLKEFDQVDSVRYVDKQAAWNTFEKEYGATMLDAVDENPFPASVQIFVASRFQRTSEIEQFMTEIAFLPGVDGSAFTREIVSKLEHAQNYFAIAGICILIVIVAALYYMISNAIKMTIYARKELVTNMGYVGATNFYIAAPFVLEGMLQGFFGALAAYTVLLILRIALTQFRINWYSEYHVYLFALGIVFGFLGSMNATNKFLIKSRN
ncbi:MAG: hypothetical protein GF398_11650 [Chitinivibrionales bacterium]|nr:hypothetical protein [Chitinivibrionales bacterium]